MADVQSSTFVLTAATIMVGNYGVDDVFSLTPAANSVGMVKNVKITLASSQVELLNGIQQIPVDSQKSAVKLTLGFEGYEFSARNLQLALGSIGTTVQYKRGALTAVMAAASTTISFTSNPVPGEVNSAPLTTADVPPGSTLLVQQAGQRDFVWPVTTIGAATLVSGTFTVTVAALPASMNFAVGDAVWVANKLNVGSTQNLDFFNVKVAGVGANNNKPLVAIMPKVKIVAGFDLNMSETAYSNLPFSIQPYLMYANEAVGLLAGYNKTQITVHAAG